MIGVFQVKRARSYAEENSSTSDLSKSINYTIYRCKEFRDLIRIPTRSAHANRITYNPIISFTSDEITEWWCDCPIGSRFVDCCSHIASAIWFPSYARYQVNNYRMPSNDYLNFAVDVSQLSDFYDSTDDEDDS